MNMNIRNHNFKEVLPNGDIVDRKAETKIIKTISGGWNMTYKDPLYDFIETLTPAKFKLYRFIEDIILSRKGEDDKIVAVNLVMYPKCPTNDPVAIGKLLTHMVKHNIIMETKAKHYLYNPFVVIPAFGDGEILQREWNSLRKNKEFKRRGRDILDEYYDHKTKNKDNKLTFEDWIKDNEDIEIEPEIIKSKYH